MRSISSTGTASADNPGYPAVPASYPKGGQRRAAPRGQEAQQQGAAAAAPGEFRKTSE